MSRYALLTTAEHLEIVTGYDEGIEAFFLVIGDVRSRPDETGNYLFHNIDHHPGVAMTLGEVAATLQRFGILLPPHLATQLARDVPSDLPATRSVRHLSVDELVRPPADAPTSQPPIGVVRWQEF